VYLSPLHGALLASVAANKGVWKDPVLFEPDANAPPQAGEQVLSPEVARDLATLMEATVTKGTARRTFRERGMGVPGAVGKTGTLADRAPFRDYSWFVGFAPKDNPKVVVAAVIVNEPIWHIRATWLGREAMRLGLARLPPGSLAPAKEEPAESQEEPLEEEASDEESLAPEVAGGVPTVVHAPAAKAENTGP
jgi:membrane peptidoglycan carboxypeptidase